MGTGVSREQVRPSRASARSLAAREFSLWPRMILAVDFLGPHVLLAHMGVCVGVSCLPRGPATCGGREARANNRNDSSLTPRRAAGHRAPPDPQPWRREGLDGPVPAAGEPGGSQEGDLTGLPPGLLL